MSRGRGDSRAGRIVVRLLGAAMLVGGVAVLAPVGWDLWVVSPAASQDQQQAAEAQSRAWASSGAVRTTSIPVAEEPRATGDAVAVLTVPRFGAHWKRLVRQGVDEASVLNSATAGVGHYPGTSMPGGVGNFAVAGHDTGYGDAFLKVSKLRIGDRIVVQTAEGVYTYRFRNFQWVQPDQVAVLQPVPMRGDRIATARLITLTTCDPPYDAKERMIAYGVLESFAAASA